MSIFTNVRNTTKAKSFAVGCFVFWLTPAGFAASLFAGAVAAIVTAAGDIASKSNDPEGVDLSTSKEFNEIAQPALLTVTAATILALPIGGLFGFALKIGMILGARRVLFAAFSKTNVGCFINELWVFNFRLDGCSYKFSF